MAAVLVLASMESAAQSARASQEQTLHQRAFAALDSVLSRREAEVVRLAGQGDPVEIARWQNNYGVDIIGDAEVRWKIEPVRTPPTDASGNPVFHITNPSPDPNWTPPTQTTLGGEQAFQTNDVNYMFRIAGEARIGVDPQAPPGLTASGQQVLRPAVAVQGVRYAAVIREPLFRYVIFYAARGAKGDLELSHADQVTIRGSVHTNGALYLGSGLKANDRVARVGPLTGTLAPAVTQIGPDIYNQAVRVNGVDGIFRLSKPLMYSIINGFPLTDNSSPGLHGNPNATTGLTPITWSALASYDLTTPIASMPLPLDPPGASLASLAEATDHGRRINPYRIKDGCAAITENSLGAQDNRVTINGVAIRGVPYMGALSGPQIANDARDLQRPADQRWAVISVQQSAPGFNGKARTRVTGQQVKQLPERMRNRGFEPQRLEYHDQDGDEATDEHEFARPLFVRADGTTTTDYPRATLPGFPAFPDGAGGNAPVVEEPGQYLRYAMGAGNYMVRYPDGTGWYIRTLSGQRPTEAPINGLIIRERPAPSVDHWPGTENAGIVPPHDTRWMPYAYGKHWYPSNFPFFAAHIAEVCAPPTADPWGYSGNFNGTSITWQDDPLHPARINDSEIAKYAAYYPGGRLIMSGAQNAAMMNTVTPLNNYLGYDDYYRRKPYFYAQNWRFVHLGRHAIDTTRNGLRVTVCVDRPSGVGSQSFVGGPVGSAIVSLTAPSSGIIATPNVANAASGIQPSLANQRRSVRFEGFLTPTATNLYYIRAYTSNSPSSGSRYTINNSSASHQWVRIWVDGRLVFTNWGVSSLVENPIRLHANRAVPIQIDYAVDGSNASPSLFIGWQTVEPVLGSETLIPSSAFNPPRSAVGIPRSNFQQAIVRIDRPFQIQGPQQMKVGLMIRDGSSGLSPLLNGAAQYAFIGFSPTRGVFTERRGERHLQELRTLGVYYIGNGTETSGTPVNSRGEIAENPNTVAGVTRTARLLQTDLTPVTIGSIQTETSGLQTSAVTWNQQPTPYSGPMSKDVGGGKIWTILDPFSIGTFQGTRTAWYNKRKYRMATQVLTVQLQNHVAPFDDINDADGTDHNRYLRIYSAATGTTKYTVASIDNRQIQINTSYLTGGTPPADNRWYLFGGSSGNRTQLRYTLYNASYGAWVSGSSVTQTLSVGGPTTAWITAGQLRINKNGTVVNATAADLTAITGLSITEISTATPSSPWTGPTPSAPADSACPDPATPANPTVPDFVSNGGLTFSVERSSRPITFDLNGWISNSQSWLSAAVPQYVPTQGALWPASWAGNSPTTWPLTRSWRPDVHPGSTTWTSSTVNPTGNAGLQTGNFRLTDDISVPSTITGLWLRISQSGSTLSFAYSTNGTTWTSVPGTLDISNWGSHLLIGPAIQSGDVNQVVTATFTNLRIQTSLPAPNDVIDATDWDTDSSGQDLMGRYLASQYQVWFGTREITEDFFTWTDPATGRRIASEDWIWNAREFWSQSRWWDVRRPNASPHLPTVERDLVEKDPVTSAAENFTKTTIREAFAKTTLLTLDIEALQNYLRSRTISQAMADRLPGHMDVDPSPPAQDYVLRERFSGLIYAARTNRYPWNPNLNPWLKSERLPAGADTTGINPWSPHWLSPLPNSRADMGDAPPEIGNDASLRSPPPPPQGSYAWLNSARGHRLQPYAAADLKEDLPLKPQQFHHGVRIVNAHRFDWGYDGTRSVAASRPIGPTTAYDWQVTPIPEFGLGKTTIVTPHALYVQGNCNVDRFRTTLKGAVAYRFTPVALMGDTITFLSNAWLDGNAQIPGLTVSNVSGPPSVTGSGTLATMSSFGPRAANTEYNAAIATHNLPTTRDRLAEGQTAAFVDSFLLLENWNGCALMYLGSLVVMDTRRYTQAFLLDSFKTYGTTPFGFVDNSGQWRSIINNFVYRRPDRNGNLQVFKVGMYGYSVPAAHWNGQSPAVYSEPQRIYEFNYDLLTEEGTPPFAPFGVSTTGVGGWARVVK
ncbi:MAG: PA14 domain-containing protein [Planctomycetota bacterium]|nr:PA14 domain-containing protein [Planctomycetota bacterium]